MGAEAQFFFAAPDRDAGAIAAASAELWAELSLGEEARQTLRRDGLDERKLRLTGPHPFDYAPGEDEDQIAVRTHATDSESAEAMLDLFRVYFLRRLIT